MSGQKEKCENCRWWQDFTDRVSACVSKGHSSTVRNRIELRACKYVPCPQITDHSWIYTDSDYVCSCFEEAAK